MQTHLHCLQPKVVQLIDITGTGNNAQTVSGTSTKAHLLLLKHFHRLQIVVLRCTVTRPPLNFGSSAPHIDGEIFGYTPAEKSLLVVTM